MRAFATAILRHFAVALRALLFVRSPLVIPAGGFATVLVMIGLAVTASAVTERWLGGPDAAFDPSGISAALAAWALFAALVQSLRRSSRPFDAGGLIASCVGVSCVLTVVGSGLYLLPYQLPLEPQAGLATFLFVMAWLALGHWRLGRAATQGMPRRLGIALPLVALLPMVLLPGRPMFSGENDFRVPTVWDAVDVWQAKTAAANPTPRPPRIDVEAAWERQPDLIAKSLAKLAPSRPGVPELYFVGAAAFAEQDVFKREITSARQIADEYLGSDGRSLLLVNHRDTVQDTPLASVTNLEKVLAGVGKVMDVDKDLLVLFATSHGSKGSFAVSFPRFGLNDLTPARLAAMLDKSGIKNRVIILSACHSGSFLPALEHPSTLVLAAAHADKTSFGCSNEREWTYFGDALFNHALRRTTSFIEAFNLASKTVAEWEAAQGLDASEPQMFVGHEIGAKLDALQRRLTMEHQAALAEK